MDQLRAILSTSGNTLSTSGASSRRTSTLDELDSGIRKLADNPETGMKRDHVRDGYRVLFVGSHSVYYTVLPDTVHIIRVLHGSMDPDRHLE